MPAPSSSLATLRPDLGTFMEFDLAMSRAGFIGLSVLPVLEVGVQSATFGKIAQESLIVDRDTARAPGAPYARGSWEFTEDSYATKENGAEEPIDDRESAMYANYFDAELISAQRARDVVVRRLERRIADLVFASGTFTPTAITNEWDDYANATPIDDVEAAVLRLYEKGIKANALVITWKVFRNLRQCEQIIARIASSGAGSATKPSDITAAMLSAVFDIPRIVVGDAQRNSADQGQAVSLTPIWDDEYAMVTRVAETHDVRECCLGRTFHWSADGSAIGAAMESYRDETVRSDVVRARMDTHEKLLYAAAGELLSNITA